MHVAIDLRMVGRQLHGIARYALELSRRLPALAPESRFSLLVGGEFEPGFLGDVPPNVHLVHARSKFLSVEEQVELPLLLRRLEPDLYHSPSFSVPAAWRGPLALTIHDANHIAFPQHYGRFHGQYYKQIVRPGALRSKLLLTVSEFAREEVERRLDLPHGHAKVVYNGVDPAFRPPAADKVDALRRRLNLPERFVLYVGNTKPHKNVEQLVDAFRLLDPKLDLSLVLCAGPKAEALKRRAGERGERVLLLDGVDDADLPLLYAAARVFAFPSLYEGFGLPPLEAMACGTPVVATRATALPEVCGDAAELVEPHDARGLATAIARIDADEARRAELVRRGRDRAGQFSWDESARQILSAYRSAVSPVRARAPRPVNAVPGPRGAKLKVLFCVRQNLWTLPGGDATQILRTKAALEELGVEVILWSDPRPPTSGSFDLAHLFHLTRLDTYVHAEALDRDGLPFVLSTIYWPTHEFERRGYVGALRVLHTALSEGPADVAKNWVRAVLADGDWRWALLPGAMLPLEQRIDFLVKKSLTLLPNSQSEGDVLRAFGATRIHPIVNAADPAPKKYVQPKEALPEKFVLCAGRIEPRKNQLALVQALEGFELPLVIVGDPGPMHGDYYKRVQKAAAGKVLLLPARPREQLYALYSRAEAHVAPAWYETPGLVSLEAAAAGTRVVTTDRGSTRDYFKDDAAYLDPGDKQSIRAAVERALATPKTTVLQERVNREFTWQRAGEQTLEAYEAVLRDLDRQEPPPAAAPGKVGT